MSVTRLIAAALIVAATAIPVSADVTLRLEGRGHMLGTVAEDATEYRKGLKLRTDSTSNGVSVTTIIDLGAGRMIMLWHHSKTAEVIERKQIAELFSKENSPVVRPSITATTQFRQIAGWTCIVHNVKGTYPMSGMDMVPPTMVTQGTVCLVKNGPGQADYTAFYQAAGKNASLFDPSLGMVTTQQSPICRNSVTWFRPSARVSHRVGRSGEPAG
jgi:hypothetical protein